MKRCISLTIILTMIIQLIFSGVAMASEGVAQPEAAQFEPVETSDMVNLYTGNFVYSIPLLEVPGPEGGWPVSMAYHAGIGPNTEATWVGLGWTLNPGAINRFVSGYPDDYYNGSIVSTFDIPEQSGWGVGVGISYGPVGVSVNYDSHSGYGVNANISLIGALELIPGVGNISQVGLSQSAGIGFDVSLQVGTSGVGLSTSLGLSVAGGSGIGASIGASAGIHSSQKPSTGAGAGLSLSDGRRSKFGGTNSMSLIGVSFSSNREGASFSVAGTGFQSQAGMEGSGHFNMSSSSFSLPIGMFIGVPGLGISISYYEWEWWLKEKHVERSFGCIHQLGFLCDEASAGAYDISNIWGDNFYNIYDDACKYAEDEVTAYFTEPEVEGGLPKPTADNPWDIFIDTKMERKVVNDVLFSSEDMYQVNAQGLGGSFQPFFEYGYKIYDNTDEDAGNFDLINGRENFGPQIKFRFLGDQGGNFASAEDWGYNFHKIRTDINGYNDYGSKIIKPAIDKETGRILGFRITAEDGKIYEFFRPVDSHYQYSYTKSGDLTNTMKMSTTYATSWLLTGVKGPDYYDKGGNGFSADDWGYWVHFTYEELNKLVAWRAPYEDGTYTTPSGDDTQSYSEGLKSKLYLKSIETASHIAQFHTSPRKDNLPSNIKSVVLTSNQIEKRTENNYGYAQIIFPFDRSKIETLIQGTDAQVRLVPHWSPPLKYHLASDEIYKNPHPNTFEPGWHYAHELLANGIWYESDFNEEDPSEYHSELIDLSSGFFDSDDNDGKWYLDSTIPYCDELNSNVVALEAAFVPSGGGLYEIKQFNANVKGNVCSVGMEITSSGPLSTKEFARQLDSVTVHKKECLASGKTNYTASFDNPTIESVVFDFNYSMVQGAQNSDANGNEILEEANIDGKLTLRGFQKRGRNGVSALPPTSFSYLYPNEEYNEHKWDYWNGYTSIGTEESHMNSQTKSIADKDASIWNLGYIKTPLGSTIRIEYKSDQISYIGDTPYTIYGGGHRVKAISVGNKKTKYVYHDGCTPVMPSGYKEMSYFETNEDLLLSGGFNILGPSPGVGYFSVEVYDVDYSDNMLNGKTVHEFYTARDYSYNVPGDMTIKDRTGIYGRLKGVKTYELSGGNLLLVKNDQMSYAFSKDLANSSNRRVIRKGTLLDIESPVGGREELGLLSQSDLGLTQQKYKTKNQSHSTKSIDHQRENIFMVGTISTTYFFDEDKNSSGSVTMSTNNLAWDAYSGKVLISKNVNSNREQIISEQIPAYWRYSGMEDKNMLTQIAGTNGYILPFEKNFIYDRWLFQTENDSVYDNTKYIKSASVTTWKDWSGTDNWGIWRQNDTYVATRTGEDFIDNDFTDWATFDNESIPDPADGDFPGIWKRTSNITNYDRYGHPTEERGLDGTYTSSKYGYDGALPIAIAKNAKEDEIRYYDFEWLEDVENARTGVGCGDYDGSYIYDENNTRISTLDPPAQGGNYLVTYWYKPNGENKWKYDDMELAPNTDITITGKGIGKVDDIRIHPINATMSTFAYDPLTWQVTSITDANNITTYYEYDDVGRLIRVLDQDRFLINRYEYNYKRGQ